MSRPSPCFTSLFGCSFVLLLSMMLQVQSLASYKAEWMDLKSASKITPPRSGHVAFTHQGQVHVFGGYVEEQGSEAPNRYVKNDIWKWSDAGWVQEECDQAPNSRLASAAAVLLDKPMLFGGWDPQTPGTGGIILDDVVQLQDMKWNTLDVRLPDGPTSRHVAVALDDCVVLHTHRCTDHVLLVQQKEESVIIHKQATTGEAPSPRGLHAATLLSENRILVTCGAAQDGNMKNEVFVLDTATWEWTRVDTNDGPCPRASPCVCTVQDGVAVLFGGAKRDDTTGGLEGCSDVWLLSIDESSKSGTWELLLESGVPGRNAATMNRIPAPSVAKDAGGHYFVLHGGWEPFQKTYNDNYVLRVST